MKRSRVSSLRRKQTTKGAAGKVSDIVMIRRPKSFQNSSLCLIGGERLRGLEEIMAKHFIGLKRDRKGAKKGAGDQFRSGS